MNAIILTEESELRSLILETVTTALTSLQVSAPQPDPQPENEDLITRKEASKLLQVSLVTLNDWQRKGLLPFYRMNRKVYFRKSEIFDSLRKIKRT